MLTRRSFLATSGAMVGALPVLRPGRSDGWELVTTDAEAATESREIVWRDVREWGVEGRGWSDTERYFDRLPATAKGVVPDAVLDLSRHSAGMTAGFVTDAAAIHVRYALLSDQLAMSHMPATGVSGIDLYGRGGDRWRWAAVFRPALQQNEGALICGVDPGEREWRLYLPLYNGVDSLDIGVPEGATFRPAAPRAMRPVVFYGTSILHGALRLRLGAAIGARTECRQPGRTARGAQRTGGSWPGRTTLRRVGGSARHQLRGSHDRRLASQRHGHDPLRGCDHAGAARGTGRRLKRSRRSSFVKRPTTPSSPGTRRGFRFRGTCA